MYGTPGGILSVFSGAVRYACFAISLSRTIPDPRRTRKPDVPGALRIRRPPGALADPAALLSKENARMRAGTDVAPRGGRPMVLCAASVLPEPHTASNSPERVLSEQFGLAAFYPWQREAIGPLL